MNLAAGAGFVSIGAQITTIAKFFCCCSGEVYPLLEGFLGKAMLV